MKILSEKITETLNKEKLKDKKALANVGKFQYILRNYTFTKQPKSVETYLEKDLVLDWQDGNILAICDLGVVSFSKNGLTKPIHFSLKDKTISQNLRKLFKLMGV